MGRAKTKTGGAGRGEQRQVARGGQGRAGTIRGGQGRADENERGGTRGSGGQSERGAARGGQRKAAGEERKTQGRSAAAKGKKGAAGSAVAGSTEERIKAAARKLFTQKGFAAIRTRDIAQEAGINLALLNYYFRSKQKLFDLVMMENFRKFLQGMTINFQDKTLSMEKRVEKIVSAYIDFLTEFPDLPLFILNEIRGNPSKLATQINEEVGPTRSLFFKELMQSKKEGKIDLEPFHFVANLVGLTVFPFVSRPLLQRVTGVSDEQFAERMQERKKLVPIWIRLMLMPHGAAEAGMTGGSGAAEAGAAGQVVESGKAGAPTRATGPGKAAGSGRKK